MEENQINEQADSSNELSSEKREKLKERFEKAYRLMDSDSSSEAENAFRAARKNLKLLSGRFADLLEIIKSSVSKEEVEQILTEYVQANEQLKISEEFLLEQNNRLNILLGHFREKSFAPPNLDPENFKTVLEKAETNLRDLADRMERYRQPEDAVEIEMYYNKAVSDALEAGPRFSPSGVFLRVFAAIMEYAGYPVSTEKLEKTKKLVDTQKQIIKEQAETINRQSHFIAATGPEMMDSIGLLLDASSPKSAYDRLINSVKDLELKAHDHDLMKSELGEANRLIKEHLQTIKNMQAGFSAFSNIKNKYQKIYDDFRTYKKGNPGNSVNEGRKLQGNIEAMIHMADIHMDSIEKDKRIASLLFENEKILKDLADAVIRNTELTAELAKEKLTKFLELGDLKILEAMIEAGDAMDISAKSHADRAEKTIQSLSAPISHLPAFSVAAGSMMGLLAFVSNSDSLGAAELTASMVASSVITATLASLLTDLKYSGLRKSTNLAAQDVKSAVNDWQKFHGKIEAYEKYFRGEIEGLNNISAQADKKLSHMREHIQVSQDALEKAGARFREDKEGKTEELLKRNLADEARILSELIARHEKDRDEWRRERDEYEKKLSVKKDWRELGESENSAEDVKVSKDTGSQLLSLHIGVENLHLGHVDVLRNQFRKASNENRVSVSLDWPTKKENGRLDGDIIIEGTKMEILRFLNQNFATVIRVGKPDPWGRNNYHGIPSLNGNVVVDGEKISSIKSRPIENPPGDIIENVIQGLKEYDPPIAEASI